MSVWYMSTIQARKVNGTGSVLQSWQALDPGGDILSRSEPDLKPCPLLCDVYVFVFFFHGLFNVDFLQLDGLCFTFKVYEKKFLLEMSHPGLIFFNRQS